MDTKYQQEKPLQTRFSVRTRDSMEYRNSPARGRFIPRGVIATVVTLVIILIILVVVLGALLGKARSTHVVSSRGHSQEGTSNPESRDPTPFPGVTTPGTEIWWNVRLPSYITPRHYDVTILADLVKLRFNGHVNISIVVTRSTQYILVHTNKLNVTTVSVRKSSEGALVIKEHFWFEKNQFYVIHLETWLQSGEYVINMVFESDLRSELGGFYIMEYKLNDGTFARLAATQFSPADARKAFPCFDEPAMKATFNVTLVHDPSLIAVSNMPIYKSQEKDGWKYDKFKKTVVMSTYLVAFAICDFRYVEFIHKNSIKVRLYAPEEQIDQVEYASKITDHLFTFYEEYFQIEYTLPKSDMIAIPNFLYGAMENWGLITYRDWNLLYKPNVSSSANTGRKNGFTGVTKQLQI